MMQSIRFGAPIRTTAPNQKPITLADVKAHCRITASDEDALTTSIIGSVVDIEDGYKGRLGRALITQQWQIAMSAFPATGMIRLPVGDVQQVDAVYYYDAAGITRTLSASTYGLQTDAVGFYLRRTAGASWPDTAERDDAVTVQWTAGYGPAPSAVPEGLRMGLVLRAQLALIAWRGGEDPQTIAALERAADMVLDPYRVTAY